MVDTDVRDDRDARVDDIRRVPRASQADLDDRDIDRLVGKPPERGRGHDLEVRRIDVDTALDERHRVQHLVERFVVDGLTVDRHALVHPFEVRAREGADPQPERLQQLRHHPDRARLAVGAGHVNRRELLLG